MADLPKINVAEKKMSEERWVIPLLPSEDKKIVDAGELASISENASLIKILDAMKKHAWTGGREYKVWQEFDKSSEHLEFAKQHWENWKATVVPKLKELDYIISDEAIDPKSNDKYEVFFFVSW